MERYRLSVGWRAVTLYLEQLAYYMQRVEDGDFIQPGGEKERQTALHHLDDLYSSAVNVSSTREQFDMLTQYKEKIEKAAVAEGTYARRFHGEKAVTKPGGQPDGM